ncbi:hypothetical protein HBB16_21360 [Pseudonocardia sp. MCCB 268]|nr:hypothetical protein [Pseudonocardia cytotoxica]
MLGQTRSRPAPRSRTPGCWSTSEQPRTSRRSAGSCAPASGSNRSRENSRVTLIRRNRAGPGDGPSLVRRTEEAATLLATPGCSSAAP